MAEATTTRNAALEALMRPASIAVVGASPTHVWGRRALENIRDIGYTGTVAAINPKYEDIIGYPCYPRLGDLPFVPDAVLVGVNRARAADVVEQAAEIGARGAVVFAIGFDEAGPDGHKMQTRIQAAARDAGMALIGPNCQGYVNFWQPSALYLEKVHKYNPGPVGLFSESGSITAALTNNTRGVRWSTIVSCGNEAVSDSADLLGYFVDDLHTRVICGFVETIRDPEHFFFEAQRALAADKPVVILKSGRTEAARRAATAHSGALSPPDRLVDELMRHHGVVRVDTMEEMLETALALQGRRAQGNRVAVMTASGGQIELILDETERTTLTHPPFEPHTQNLLRDMLPDFLSTSNPLDFWGIDDYQAAYPVLLNALAADANIDVVAGIADPNHYPTGDEGAERGPLDSAAEVAARTDKVVAMICTVDGSVPGTLSEQMLAQDVLFLSGIRVGIKALENLVKYSLRQRVAGQAPESISRLSTNPSLGLLNEGPVAGPRALDFLSSVGIPVAPHAIVTDEQAGVEAAAGFGYPVVLKVADASCLHKTENGGVILHLRDAAAVREAVRRLKASGASEIMVQPQLEGGTELILGLQRDATLGSFVLIGLGGIWTEVLNDVAIRPVGLRPGEAAQMIDELRGRKLLEGARGAAPIDREALIDAIERLDALGQQAGDALDAIDINPVIATSAGIVAVDALVVPRQAREANM